MKKLFRSVFLSLIIPLGPLAGSLAAGGEAFKIPQEKIRSEPDLEAKVQPVVLLGGGVGALTSALYLARAGLEPVVIQGPLPGGLLTQSHSIQNWPGEMDIDGNSLTDKIRSQAAANGALLIDETVVKVDFSKRPFEITMRSHDLVPKEKTIKAESVIIATGTKPNFLGIPGEQAYWGKGVTNCATCDGSFYKGRVVGVVGGGDAAVLEAMYLSKIAKEVHVFIRKDSFKGIEEKRIQTLLATPNIKVHYRTSLAEVKGDGTKVTGVVLKETGAEFPLDGLFLAIGSTPNSDLFKRSLVLDAKGYIQLKKDQETSVEGVYAIGDIVDPHYKQAISAAGDGAKAALQAQQFVSQKGTQPLVKNQNPAPTAVAKPVLPTISPIATEVIEIATKEQFYKELNSSETPVVVDFYATWCGPCKRISPLIESSANLLSGKVKFLKVNVDLVKELSSNYGIQAMPTVLLLDPSGTVSDRKVGTQEISDLLKQLAQQYPSAP